MGALSRFWFFVFEFTFIVIMLTGVSGQSSECVFLQQLFPGCLCRTLSDDSGVLLGNSVDCSSQGRSAVPAPSASYSRSIYELRLNNNSIVSLGDNILPNLNIIKLDLSDNAISSVHNNTFGSLGSNLKILILSGNSASEPPAKAFLPLQQLEDLTLRNYNVPHLTDSQAYFLSLIKLRHLTLDNWKLESIGPGSFLIHSANPLLSLTLLNQSLQTLPLDELHSDDLLNLQKLHISSTFINTVSAFAFSRLSHIQELDLTDNHIDTLEYNCFNGTETTLTKLNLSKNILIDDVSKLVGLKDLTKLKELDLSSNHIRSIPNLSMLHTTESLALYLSKNKITSIAMNAFAGVADKLRALDLSLNEILSIDANSFTGVTKLEVLKLSHQLSVTNPLVLPSSLTQTAGTLKQLYIDGQKMSSPELWSVIGKLSMLEILNLTSVQLISIPDMALVSLTNLKQLDLSYNSLKELTQAALAGPRSTLKYLSLTGNAISTLSSCMFYQYTSYPVMTMGFNSLICNCSVRWLWNSIKDGSIIFTPGQEPVCSDNQPLASKKVEDFCQTPYTDPQCSEYYTTTAVPSPKLTMSFGQIDSSSITVFWALSDSRDLRNFTVQVTNSNSPIPVYDKAVSADLKSVTVKNLTANTQYHVCVVAFFNTHPSVSFCAYTSLATTTTKTEQQTDSGQEEIGIIIGAVIGAVVLLAILAAIGYLLIVRRKPKKKIPDNVPVQPRNFSKPELPSMNEETRTFSKPKRPRGSSDTEHREGMQVVAISDGQTGHGRVGRAHMLNSDGSYKTNGDSKPSSTSGQSSHETYENDRGPLPPTPSRLSPAHVPAGYYNMGYRDDKYDEIAHGKESML